jgi:hypothetical protein
MAALWKLGEDEGPNQGPKAGHGARIAHPVVGGSDMEGTPGDALPDYRGRAAADTPAEESEEKKGESG